MRRSAAHTEGSGLGLARIRAEGDMTLSFTVSDEGEVCLRACSEPMGEAKP
jgi:hypothetical protein